MVKRHWLTLALVVSLALNLMALGGAIARWQWGERRPPPLIWALKDIDEPTRDALKPLLQKSLENTALARESVRQISERLRVQIEQDPMDTQAVALSLQQLREASSAYQAQVHASALDILPKVSARERAKIAGRLLRPGGAPPPRHPEAPHRPQRPAGERPVPPSPEP